MLEPGHHELRLTGGNIPAFIERLIDAHEVPFDDAAERLRRHDASTRYREIGRRFGHLDALPAMLYTDSAVLLPDKHLEKVDRATMAYVALSARSAAPLPAGHAAGHRGVSARPLRPGRARAVHR